MKKAFSMILSLAMFACVAMPAQAADYPSKPINLLTVFSPGGSSDVSHRTIEKFAKDYISQPIVVTYKAGAGGEIGWTQLAQDKADGYSIGGVDLPHIVLQPMVRSEGQPGYKTEDLNPICGLVADPTILIAPGDSPWKDFKSFIEYAKANPGKVTMGGVGTYTGDHIFIMQLQAITGAEFTMVPYPSGGKAMAAVLSGEVDCYASSGSNFLRMENVIGLAVATDDRFELAPELPTLKELGVDLSFAKYRGIAAQKDFPAEAKAYLEEKMSALCANPEYQDSVRKVGLMPLYQSSAEFAECIKREAETARAVMIKLGKIKE